MKTIDSIDFERKQAETQKNKKRTVFNAMIAARILDEAEATVKKEKAAFDTAIDKLMKQVGVELWHTDVDGGKFFWRNGKVESIQYANRFEALEAMFNDNIEWR